MDYVHLPTRKNGEFPNSRPLQCVKASAWSAILPGLLILSLTIVKMHNSKTALQEPEVTHVVTVSQGADHTGRVEMLLKSILLFHAGVVHIHIYADASSREVLSTMFQTWRLKRVRWSIYEMESMHDSVKYIATWHTTGVMGFLRLMTNDLLPLEVETVSFIDTDMILLDDITSLHNHFHIMRKKGALFAGGTDMYHRSGMRLEMPHSKFGPNAGLVLLDLKKMRETNWEDIWRDETLRMLHKFGPLMASEQDIFASLEIAPHSLGFRLPCVYNFQVGETSDEKLCLGEELDYNRVKIPHWTERYKWLTPKPSAQHFTKIYQCIEMADWRSIEDNDSENSPPRTLKYMRKGETTNSSDVTLVLSTSFQNSLLHMESATRWPGEVHIIVHGTDAQRMYIRDFLLEQKRVIGKHISVHFIHPPPDQDIDQVALYAHKIGADLARTDKVLVALMNDALDISKATHDSLATQISTKLDQIFILRKVNTTQQLGFASNKRFTQRANAEWKTSQEFPPIMKLNPIFIDSPECAAFEPSWNTTLSTYPASEFCQQELSKRHSLVEFKLQQ